MLTVEEARTLGSAMRILAGYKPGREGQIEFEVQRGRMLEAASIGEDMIFNFVNAAAHIGEDPQAREILRVKAWREGDAVEGVVLQSAPPIASTKLRTCCPTPHGGPHHPSCEVAAELDPEDLP